MLSEEIAKGLLNVQAIQINMKEYFTWTSGLKSPIYCDNRLTMSYPTLRQKITQGFIEKISAFNFKPDIIAGCATAGIPHAAWLADALNLPMIYVRSSPKKHGKGNQIEGSFKHGQQVIIIEDLISTGGSSINVANVLRDAGLDVLGVFGIFTYGLMKAKENFSKAGISYETLTNFDQLIEVLEDELGRSERRELIQWRKMLDE